jgi:cobaltochelatase CobS
VKLEIKDYSHFEAFGEGFSKTQKVMGFAPNRCPFVPRRNPEWEWPRAILRDLLVYWESGGSDGLYVFGPHGAGKSSVIRQFCASLGIPLYQKSIIEGVEFQELVTHLELANGSTIPWYSWLPLAMGAEDLPGFFLANELDRADPSTAVGLHDTLDGEPLAVHLGGLEQVERSEFFRLSGTGNSALRGDRNGLNPSVRQQDLALQDRFRMVKMGYPDPDMEMRLLARCAPQLPEQLRESMVKCANEIRALFMAENDADNALPLTMSPRVLIRWARMTWEYREGQNHGEQPVYYALERTLYNSADGMPEVRRALEEIVNGVLGPNIPPLAMVA